MVTALNELAEADLYSWSELEASLGLSLSGFLEVARCLPLAALRPVALSKAGALCLMRS